jgi:hypothetical protein
MREILLLECIHGYEFELKNGEIHYVHVVGPLPDLQEVMPLFQAIREKRSQAIQYLIDQAQPVDTASDLWSAAEKAQTSAKGAEEMGDHQLAEAEWQRSIRLFAAAAEASGAVDPQIPWPDWIAGYAVKLKRPSEDTGSA